ncbi:helix-turn-helix domain-containing protein [Saccharopolyspora sp. NPDC000359]|uniref:NACHT domain-containing protein n=1 Tax=Saccharopolyspora sp. NPDC000359 TaxID=3154251 RepID=UPI00331A89DD
MAIRFGAVLRQLRTRSGMTQERLAERSGVAVRTIRRLETNPSAAPRIATVNQLAGAFPDIPDAHRRMLDAIEPGRAVPPDREEPPQPAEPEAPPKPTEPRTASQGALADAADQLRQAVESRWQREEEQRRVHDPFPLPVRFEPVAAHLVDHWDNINRVPPGGGSGPVELAGDLGQIAEAYRRIPSGRLVVLGEAGAGKTVLALRFTLDHLRTRTGDEPVPVVFSLGSWDPTATGLRDWLIDQLLRDHPGLVASAPGGSTLAAALVESGRVLPVLDGFDEVADGLHRAALHELNSTALPFLLTSRPEQFERATESTTLAGAAGVQLIRLDPTDLVNYLPRTAHNAAWQPVVDALRADDPAGRNLAAALSTPLMIGLARAVYSDAPGKDPADLLDGTRFPTPEAIGDHLLSSFVPTAYRPRPGRNREPRLVQRWLGHLAQHLDQRETPDIAWWQLSSSVRRSTRILLVVLAVGTCIGLLDFLVLLPYYLVRHGAPGFGIAVLDGLLVGTEVGLVFGLIHGVVIVFGRGEFRPIRMRLRLRHRNQRSGRLRRDLATRFGVGALGGIVLGIGHGPMNTLLLGLQSGFPDTLAEAVRSSLIKIFVFALVYGLVVGTAFALVRALEAPRDISTVTSPADLVAANRATVLSGIAAFAPVIMLGITVFGQLVVVVVEDLTGEPLRWLPEAFLSATIGGIGGAVSYALAFTAWGQWVLLVRFWLPLTGRLPWDALEFFEDAYRRGVLRQSGAVYQFRHARLQDHLSLAHRDERTVPGVVSA